MIKGNGWMGTILRVDLSKRQTLKEPLTVDLARNFVGGRGINSKILYDETSSHTEPLSPDNRLIVGTGPVTGTLGPSAGRFTVTAKSPLTGILGDANGGGNFAAELKFAGYDHIIVQGRSESPVYIWINDDEVTVRDARHLWGKNTWETEEIIRRELRDPDINTLCIGQAGENVVRLACPIATGDRAPGRTGTGAVMGSKNLKAIAVRGSKSVKIAHPKEYLKIVQKWYDDMHAQTMYATMKKLGTSHLVNVFNILHGLGIRNQQEVNLPEEVLGPLYGEIFIPRYGTRHVSCFACPTSCGNFCLVKEGPYAGEKGKKPEFGSISGLGTLVGVCDDFAFVLKATNVANQYGLDTIETGAAIAAAMNWYQEGIITQQDADGLELEWGNQQAIIELLRKIAYREGFGDILAEGPLKAAKKIGGDAERYVRHSKGMGMSTTRMVYLVGSVLALSMSPRGFDHLRGLPQQAMTPSDIKTDFPIIPGTSYDPLWAQIVINSEDVCTAADMLEVCKFNTGWEIGGSFGLDRMAGLLTAITGVDFGEELLTQACDRVSSLEKAYIVREGVRRKDDNPPHDYFEKAVWDGPNKGWQLDKRKFEELKDHYYELKGWDKKTGAPTRKKLEELGLNYVADEMEQLGVYQESEV